MFGGSAFSGLIHCSGLVIGHAPYPPLEKTTANQVANDNPYGGVKRIRFKESMGGSCPNLSPRRELSFILLDAPQSQKKNRTQPKTENITPQIHGGFLHGAFRAFTGANGATTLLWWKANEVRMNMTRSGFSIHNSFSSTTEVSCLRKPMPTVQKSATPQIAGAGVSAIPLPLLSITHERFRLGAGKKQS